ncbi:MAG: LuxR C-terminal-related transcriptional regulator [Candidatus Nanopelagicales bacterium]
MGRQPWPTVERRGEFDAIRAALVGNTQVRGALLLGEAGVGKTTVLRSVTATLGSNAHWVVGTESAREVPLGAFAHLLTTPVAADPITMLANALEAVRANKYTIVCVDDLHLLDHLSATLLQQLAVEGTLRIAATARSNEPIPETITGLWKDGYLTRIDIPAFTRPEAVTLIETALGGRLEALTADLIWQASGGNALYLRHLVEGAVESGNLQPAKEIWRLRGDAPVTTKLTALLGSRLDSLDDDETRALQFLAIGRPLALDVSDELIGRDTLERLERRGLVSIVDDNGTPRVDFMHTLIGEAVRQRAGQLASHRLAAELLAVLANHPPVNATERIRRAELQLSAGADVDTRLLVNAAADAIALMNIETAERLAKAAEARGVGFRASELLARSLLMQGRTGEGEAILCSFDPDSLNEFELAQWGITRVANLRWFIGDADAAEQILELLDQRVDHPAIRLVLDGLRSALLVLDGHLEQASSLAERVLSAPSVPAVAVGWAVFGGGMSAALSGRTADAARLAARGREVYPEVDALMRFLLALGEVRAMTLAGDFDTAESRSGDVVRVTSPSQFRARAMAQILGATVDVGRGRLRAAMEKLEESLAALSDEAAAAWIVPARLLLAQCYCGLGMDEAAAPLIAELADGVGAGGRAFMPSIRIAEAWLAAAEGHVSGAIAAAVHAADLAAEGGQRAVELMALHAAARFGDRTCLPRLVQVAGEVGGPLAAADALHAQGLIDNDAAVVFSAGVEFERIGAMLSAADAAAQASELFERTGDRRRAVEAAALAERLTRQCGGLRTPAPRASSRPLPLSAREREIANLVARGLSNPEIADRLVLSRRTVEGHLYRIFAKVDVADRDQLAAVMRRGL